ncbi:MAG: ABC transporter substrate-binding protein, partial [Chloroflexi bacterium]|nr:ABC transporter substrate-binding protein [Chloroflexota bacterium]
MVGPRRIALCILAVVALAGGAACQQTGPASSSAPSASAPTPLVVGLGFIPSVQFAQFYLAEERGYYRAAGLAVELQNRIDP